MNPAGRIKVFHLLTDKNIGGAGKHILYLLSAADRERFDYTAVLPEGAKMSEKLRAAGIRVTELPGFDKSFCPSCKGALKKLFMSEKPDIVHTHSALTAVRAAAAARVPVRIMTKHCSDLPPEYTRDLLGRTLCRAHFRRNLSAAIATDHSSADALKACGMPADMITVIENGAIPPKEHTEAEKRAFRSGLGIPEDAVIAGNFARLEPVKAQSDILAAAALLTKQAGNLYFIIAGTGSLEAELREKIAKFGLTDRVKLTGYMDDISLCMSVCTFNINTSVGTETTNLALTEGMSLGLVPIVTDVGGNRRLVENGGCGYVIPCDDPPALAAALLGLMRDPPEIAFLSEKAVSFFRESRTAERMARETEELYLGLLGKLRS